jgi:hypothetical protein
MEQGFLKTINDGKILDPYCSFGQFFYIYKHFPKFPFSPLIRIQWCEETLLNDASGIEKDRPCFPRLFIDFEVFLLHALAVSHLSVPSFQNLSLRTLDAHLGLLISLCSKTF